MASREVDLRIVAALSPAWALLDELRLDLAIARDSRLTEAELLAALEAGRGTERGDDGGRSPAGWLPRPGRSW